jgi:succinate dehydrogenase/fumarate reductase flavoprotein subunit
MPDLVVAGAGMAGLVAAAEARERGAEVEVLEKLDRPGGAMRLSSGAVWRHRTFEAFRAECPQGDERLQRLVFDRLDADIEWLEGLGAAISDRESRNPRTTGVFFDPAGMCDALVRAAGPPRLGETLMELPDDVPVVLATGGFAADRELLGAHVTGEADHLLLRSAPGATGDGLRLGLEAGAQASAGLEQIYGRNMPAAPGGIAAEDFVRAAQLYGRHATIANARGEPYEARTWSEIDVVQWTARQPQARAWLRVTHDSLEETVGRRTVGEMINVARALGAPIRGEPGAVVVETVAGVTTTLGGLAVDERGQAAPGVFAAGNDVGGIATGGYSSGLAAALVLGRVAAAAALDGRLM